MQLSSEKSIPAALRIAGGVEIPQRVEIGEQVAGFPGVETGALDSELSHATVHVGQVIPQCGREFLERSGGCERPEVGSEGLSIAGHGMTADAALFAEYVSARHGILSRSG